MRSTVARILKVNHGGEHGAVRIYAAQMIAARVRCPHLLPELAELLEHERRHEKLFRSLMPARQARPCRLMWLWGVGGAALGLLTGAWERPASSPAHERSNARCIAICPTNCLGCAALEAATIPS